MRARSFFFLAFVLVAQPPARDIYQRLREAPLPSGQGAILADALHKRDFTFIEKALSAAAPSTPFDRAALLALQGAVDFLAERMEASANAFLEAEKITPLSDADNFTLAMAQVKLQNGPAASARLQSLSTKHSANPLYLYWLGKLDYDQRRYDEAITKLTRVTELDPESVRAFNSLGLAYDMQGRFDLARTALEKAVTLNRLQTQPSPWPPHDLGYLLFRMDRLSDAESALRESLKCDPNFAQAHNHLARVLEKENQFPAALTEYERTITLDTVSPEPCYSLALLYRKLHRDPDAEKMFTEYRRRKAQQPPK